MITARQKNIVKSYFFITYLVVLWIVSDSMPFRAVYAEGWLAVGFLVVSFLLYGLYYLLPAIAITALVRVVSRYFKTDSFLPVYIAAALTGGITSLLLYANAKIFELYGMFFNGFILNLVITPGGIESLGGSSASDLGFALIVLAFLCGHAFLFWLLHRSQHRMNSTGIQLSFRFLPVTALIVTLLVHFGFAVDSITAKKFTVVAESIPFYQTVSMRSFFRKLGYSPQRDTKIKVTGNIDYPLKPIEFTRPEKPYNVIWLVAESWRADTLDEKVMPNTWQFAGGAARYTRNYSGGNGTRQAMFSMFMGMPGSYWLPFLESQRGAAIVDILQKQHYQMSFFTSAKFSYPEFDKTIFAQVPKDQLHEIATSASGWEKDRDNVSSLLSFIDRRDQARPFFTFMFFESPHARYYFPPESVIATPFRDDINYATLSKKRFKDDIVPIKNRYINSVHHLDMQYGRIFEHLRKNRLLDSTIVVVVGDHGEEFMEHGFWGHNSSFVDQQVLTPLVIYTPEMKPLVSNQMTSHMDIVPTIMPLLGVTSPSSDYALGYNLLGGEKRSYAYISDWDKVTYVDDDVKITQPLSSSGFAMTKVSSGKDEPFSGDEQRAVMQKKQVALTQLVRDAGRFFKKKESATKAQ